MRYPAIITKEGEHVLAEFPDCPGCQTFTEPGGRDVGEEASEALEGWLESRLESGDAPERPSVTAPKAPKGAEVLWVRVPAKLAAKLSLRWARHDAGLTQAELASRMGVKPQMVSKLESADSNPTIATLEKAAMALGVDLAVSFLPARTRHHVSLDTSVLVERLNSVLKDMVVVVKEAEQRSNMRALQGALQALGPGFGSSRREEKPARKRATPQRQN